MLSYGQEEFKKQNFKNALFWYNSVKANTNDPYLIGLTYNLIYCVTEDWGPKQEGVHYLGLVNIQHPQYKNAMAIREELRYGNPLCSEHEIKNGRRLDFPNEQPKGKTFSSY